MKKIALLSISLLLIGLAVFVSCKKDSNSCATCSEGKSIPTEGSVFNHSFIFKQFYNDRDEYGYLYQTYTEKEKFEDIVNRLGISTLTKSGQDNAILIAYSNKAYDTTFNLDVKTIVGYLMYYFENDKLYTRVLKVKDGKLEEDGYYSTSTSGVGIGDIADIGHYIISNQTKTAIYICKKGQGKSFYKTNLPILQYKLKLKNFAKNNLKATGGKKCPSSYNGCPSGQKGDCQTKDDSGNKGWYCTGEGGDCLIANVGGGIEIALAAGTLGVLNVDYNLVQDKLHQFEDNYLANSNTGITFIAKHYALSERLLLSTELNYSFNVIQLVYIATTMHDDFLPVVNQLLTNPTSSSILYNTQQRDNMLAFFDFLRALYPDQASKDIIDSIKLDINTNCNKTVAEVHSFFSV
jgi:hypothetical protein